MHAIQDQIRLKDIDKMSEFQLVGMTVRMWREVVTENDSQLHLVSNKDRKQWEEMRDEKNAEIENIIDVFRRNKGALESSEQSRFLKQLLAQIHNANHRTKESLVADKKSKKKDEQTAEGILNG